MNFIDKDFLLKNETAKKLFNDYAKNQPIFDFHCHLSPKEIYENKNFEDITQAWLGGDHYKWRAMRSLGIDEKYITGKETSSFEKFKMWARTIQYAIGNPLYQAGSFYVLNMDNNTHNLLDNLDFALYHI